MASGTSWPTLVLRNSAIHKRLRPVSPATSSGQSVGYTACTACLKPAHPKPCACQELRTWIHVTCCSNMAVAWLWKVLFVERPDVGDNGRNLVQTKIAEAPHCLQIHRTLFAFFAVFYEMNFEDCTPIQESWKSSHVKQKPPGYIAGSKSVMTFSLLREQEICLSLIVYSHVSRMWSCVDIGKFTLIVKVCGWVSTGWLLWCKCAAHQRKLQEVLRILLRTEVAQYTSSSSELITKLQRIWFDQPHFFASQKEVLQVHRVPVPLHVSSIPQFTFIKKSVGCEMLKTCRAVTNGFVGMCSMRTHTEYIPHNKIRCCNTTCRRNERKQITAHGFLHYDCSKTWQNAGVDVWQSMDSCFRLWFHLTIQSLVQLCSGMLNWLAVRIFAIHSLEQILPKVLLVQAMYVWSH